MVMVVMNGLREVTEQVGAGGCNTEQTLASAHGLCMQRRILTFARVRVWSDETAVVR